MLEPFRATRIIKGAMEGPCGLFLRWGFFSLAGGVAIRIGVIDPFRLPLVVSPLSIEGEGGVSLSEGRNRGLGNGRPLEAG